MNELYDRVTELAQELEANHDDRQLLRPDYRRIKALAACYELQDYIATFCESDEEYVDEDGRSRSVWDEEQVEHDFLWGLKSYDDLTGAEPNLLSMNDIDVTYWPDEQEYTVGVETAYEFRSKEAEKAYIKRLLDAFTEWMEKNGHNTKAPMSALSLFGRSNGRFKSLEDAYTDFRIKAEVFLKQEVNAGGERDPDNHGG